MAVEEVNFPEHDITDLSGLTDESFDFVLADQVLEHVAGDPFAAFRECHRVVKPGGIVVQTTCFFNMIHQHPTDFWRFTPNALRLLAEHAGLHVMRVGGWGNREAWAFMSLGFRSRPIPEDPKNPIFRMAMRQDKKYPIVTWLIARRPGAPGTEPAPLAGRRPAGTASSRKAARARRGERLPPDRRDRRRRRRLALRPGNLPRAAAVRRHLALPPRTGRDRRRQGASRCRQETGRDHRRREGTWRCCRECRRETGRNHGRREGTWRCCRETGRDHRRRAGASRAPRNRPRPPAARTPLALPTRTRPKPPTGRPPNPPRTTRQRRRRSGDSDSLRHYLGRICG